jgi:hypothetical protein
MQMFAVLIQRHNNDKSRKPQSYINPTLSISLKQSFQEIRQLKATNLRKHWYTAAGVAGQGATLEASNRSNV